MSTPLAVELVKDLPRGLLAVVHYHDAEPVTVRRRGRQSTRWTCGEHGDNAECAHALAVDLTCQARDALTALTTTRPPGSNPASPDNATARWHHDGGNRA